MVSVIIAAYNGAKFLDKFSLPSLSRQSYPDWEAIIIDDGSVDDTLEIAARWSTRDSRIKYIKHEKNQGLAAALNTGLKNAQGDIIAFLEQDDAWLKDKLKIQLERLDTSANSLVCRSFLFNTKTQKIDAGGGGNFSTLIARRALLDKIFPLPEDKQYLGIEDGLLAARLALLIERQEITPDSVLEIPEALAICSYRHASLSGHNNARLSQNRYRAALDYFANINSPALITLKKFWRRHEQQNIRLAALPGALQIIIRRLNSIIKKQRHRKNFRKIKQSPLYQEALHLTKELTN